MNSCARRYVSEVVRSLVLSAIGVSVACANAPGEGPQSAIAQAVQAARVPGVAIAVIENGEVAWISGLGVRAAGDDRPVDEHTVFEAASLSKPIVAWVALKLVDEGRLGLDRPLSQYAAVPDLADPRAARITTRMVLSHTTGLQNELIGNDRLALAFDPGERFRYSGEGYLLLQRILESATGETLEALTRRLVTGPLGMTRSGWIWRDEFDANAAIGHDDTRETRRPSRPSRERASSGFQTTVHDYSRFVRALLRREGLRPDTFDQMLAPAVRAGENIHWGLGWALEPSPTGRAAFHWGDNSNSGFTAFAWADPVDGRGLVYFANSAAGLRLVRPALTLVGGDHAAPSFIGY